MEYIGNMTIVTTSNQGGSVLRLADLLVHERWQRSRQRKANIRTNSVPGSGGIRARMKFSSNVLWREEEDWCGEQREKWKRNG